MINTLGIDLSKVNPSGGAIALGHVLGVTEAMMVEIDVQQKSRVLLVQARGSKSIM